MRTHSESKGYAESDERGQSKLHSGARSVITLSVHLSRPTRRYHEAFTLLLRAPVQNQYVSDSGSDYQHHPAQMAYQLISQPASPSSSDRLLLLASSSPCVELPLLLQLLLLHR
eukprot:COSAG06_NODE_13254_length_1277_cov_52.099321_3_plen_114_part_00